MQFTSCNTIFRFMYRATALYGIGCCVTHLYDLFFIELLSQLMLTVTTLSTVRAFTKGPKRGSV